ncbi:MAG: WG repeat-containing protein [Dorea sp.]
MYCGNCGTQNKDGAGFCKECGEPLQSPDINQFQGQTPVGGTSGSPKIPDKKKWILAVCAGVILLALIVAGSLSFKSKQEKKKYDNYVTQAEKYMEDMDYEKAEDSYLRALSIDPKQEDAYMGLIDLYIRQEDYEKAKKLLEKAEENVPGISEKKNTDNGSDKTDDSMTEIEKKQKLLEYMDTIDWVVYPTIEANDIYYVSSSDYETNSVNEIQRQKMSPYAVVETDEGLGLIAMDGQLKTDIAYEEIYTIWVDDQYILIRSEPQYEEEWDCDWDMYCLYNDRVEPAMFGDAGITVSFYSYDDDLHNTLENVEWDMGADTSIPEEPIPIQDFDEELEPYQYDYCWPLDEDSLYAVYAEDRLVTDFIYDACGSCSEGLIAVQKDGKWGYINEQGEEVIPMEYDASWKQYTPLGTYGPDEYQEFCYAASDGYVVLRKDDVWELRDVSGNIVVPAGAFEEIRPVYEGKCWVKKNGKWGVIRLKDEDNDENEETEESEVTSKDYQDIYGPILDQILEEYGEYNGYYLYDIDKDGVKELLAQEGDCEAAYMYQVYTIKDHACVYLGEITGWHSMFYADESGGKESYIIRHCAQMGHEQLYRVSIRNGSVTETEISERDLESYDDEYYSNPYPLEYIYVTDRASLQ